MMGFFLDQVLVAAVIQNLKMYIYIFFLYLAFFQGLAGPLGLKGDEGPRGPPGDPAKGVRRPEPVPTFFCKTVTHSYHITTFISLKQIIGPTGKKGARVSSLRLNALLDGENVYLESPPLPQKVNCIVEMMNVCVRFSIFVCDFVRETWVRWGPRDPRA